jgi:hypothetical protein
MTHCRYHCRHCGSHFTSLEAFDAHHQGSGANLKPCVFPDGHRLVEKVGVCRIASLALQAPVTVYEHERAAKVREHFAGRHSGSAKHKHHVQGEGRQ